MKKILICTALAVSVASQAHASNVGVSVGINVGHPAPVYVAPPVTIAVPPVFVRPPQLGFFVAADVGYDMFFHGNLYYLNTGNVWYASSYYNGPWSTVHYRTVPSILKKHKIKYIHRYRDESYREYRYEHGRDKVRHFKPHKRSNHGGREYEDSHGRDKGKWGTGSSHSHRGDDHGRGADHGRGH